MVLPFLALYINKTLGFSLEEAGIAVTVYGAGAFLSAPFAGRISDRFGARRIMIASLFLSGMMLLVLMLAHSYPLILLVTFVWAVISEAFRPASLVTITELVTPAQRKMAFSVNRLAINLGMSIGPALGGVLIIVSYPLLFVFDSVTSIVAGVVLLLAPWRLQADASPSGAPASNAADVRLAGFLSDRNLLFFLVALIPVVIVFFQHNSSMPLYLVNDLHLSESTYGLLFTVNTALIILLEVPLNIRMSRWSHSSSLALGAFLSGLGFGLMSIAGNVLAIAATVVVWSFGEMILFPSAANYMADLAPPTSRGAYMGMFQMTFSLSFALSGWLGATMLEQVGGPALWGATFLAGCISALMLRRIKH